MLQCPFDTAAIHRSICNRKLMGVRGNKGRRPAGPLSMRFAEPRVIAVNTDRKPAPCGRGRGGHVVAGSATDVGRPTTAGRCSDSVTAAFSRWNVSTPRASSRNRQPRHSCASSTGTTATVPSPGLPGSVSPPPYGDSNAFTATSGKGKGEREL